MNSNLFLENSSSIYDDRYTSSVLCCILSGCEQAGHHLIVKRELQIARLKIADLTFYEVRKGNAAVKLNQLEKFLSGWLSIWQLYLKGEDLAELCDYWGCWIETLGQSDYPLIKEANIMWRQVWCRHPVALNMLFQRDYIEIDAVFGIE